MSLTPGANFQGCSTVLRARGPDLLLCPWLLLKRPPLLGLAVPGAAPRPLPSHNIFLPFLDSASNGEQHCLVRPARMRAHRDEAQEAVMPGAGALGFGGGRHAVSSC